MVSALGYGTWGIGGTSWIGADDDTSVGTLMAARDAGINFFDTALVYGKGHSERLLASVFGKSKDILIATKVPPKNRQWPALRGIPLQEVYPRDHVFACLNKSLQNLQRDNIDLFQYHVWSDEWVDDPVWAETLRELKCSGMVRYVGISINDHQPKNALAALNTGLIDTVQVIYNIFDQSPEDELFEYCTKHDIGVIARVPFDEGSLAGNVCVDSAFPVGDFRNQYFSEPRRKRLSVRLQRLLKDMAITWDQLPDLAFRFCLSHPAVNTVIAGMRTRAHMESNLASADRGPLDLETVRKLRQHAWRRNFYTPDENVIGRFMIRFRHVCNRRSIGTSQ